MEKKRKIAVIIGSKSDLSQCGRGLKVLEECSQLVDIVGVYVMSQHRNTLELQDLLKTLVSMEVDVIITGAGWANHLTGCCDAFLRYTLRDDKVVVIGVAFEDITSEKGSVRDKHNRAAVLAMTEVPGTQVLFDFHDFDLIGDLAYTGVDGFANACKIAASRLLPKITLPAPKETCTFTLEEALEIASQK